MFRKDFILLICLVVIVGLCVVFRPLYGIWLGSLLAPSASRDAGNPNAIEEIAALKAQVAEYAALQAELKTEPKNAVRVIVFSRYPMNFKNELQINAGKNAGIKEGSGVVWNGILIGKVKNAEEDSAIVQTIFDSNFSLAVRIGKDGVDSLLQGGAQPTLTLIPKSAKIGTGDTVISAAPHFPYGMPLGEVSEVGISADNLFQAALLKLPYDLNDMKSVFVLNP